MKSRILFFLLTVFAARQSAAFGQDQFLIVEMNVENLFDCRHDEGMEDTAFLPESPRRWTWRRYWKKLNDLGRTFAALGGSQMPDLIALCEVENDSVLRDLTQRSVLRTAKYHYIMTHSRDARGMNVALLYQPATFRLVQHRSIVPDFHGMPPKRTRDLLHATGVLLTGDTLDILVCHLPSRLDPWKQGEPYRLRLTKQLRQTADSLTLVRQRAHIVITGDFNDSPHHPALTQVLEAGNPLLTTAIGKQGLYNLTATPQNSGPGIGSYYYKNVWETIDQFIINGQLLDNRTRIHIIPDECRIVRAPFLLETRRGETLPRRTYNGMRYRGGVSDHLPIVATFRYSW